MSESSSRPEGAGQESADSATEFRVSLCNLKSIFGRLVYFSSLRDEAGRYWHDGLASELGEDAADFIIKSAHEEAFLEWLSLSLERQKGDLDLYLASFTDAPHSAVFYYWARIEPHRGLIPERANDTERALYLADFEVLLGLLAKQYGEAD